MESLSRFDARVALERLVTRHPSLHGSVALSALLSQDGDVDESAVLVVLQELLIKPPLTVSVVGCFRPMVSRIVESLVQRLEQGFRQGRAENSGDIFCISGTWHWNLRLHEYVVMALSRTLELAPHVLSALLQYFSFAPPPFERLLHGGLLSGEQSGSDFEEAPNLLDVVRASYQLLQLEPSVFRDLWDWSSFFDLLQWSVNDSQSSADVRWCATQVLSVVLKMSDSATRDLTRIISQLDEDSAFACLIRWEEYCQEIAVEKAGMYVENDLDHTKLAEGKSQGNGWSSRAGNDVESSREGSFLHVEICGFELPVRKDTRDVLRSSFVMTPSLRSSLEAVVLALSQRQAVLLEGPVGAGKSSIIQELARLTGNSDVVFIHLDDQMDSKTLLGSYVCTDIPGEFQWQAGALTQAVTRGLWVVFEDMNRAPFEIFSALTPLLEDRKLHIPGRGEMIQATENFRLFSTVTTSSMESSQKAIQGRQMLSNLWRKVVLESPTDEDLAIIVTGRFPNLAPLVPKLLETLKTLKEMQSTNKINDRCIHFGHQFSSRDLMKWCSRLSAFVSESFAVPEFSLSFRERVYVEAVDCFAGALATGSDKELVVRVLANQWGIAFERAEHYNRLNKPRQQSSPHAFHIGRATLQALPHQRKGNSNGVFANTGHAMRILESIAVGVLHKEPILLVGETGTGKTTLVQYLARQISMPLIVLNMSQQSDSSDFLGGFKPVETHGICAPLFERFIKLFRLTFSLQDNTKFLERVQRFAERRKWDQVLEAFRATVLKVSRIVRSSGRSSPSIGQIKDDSAQSAKRKRPLSDKLLSMWHGFSAALTKAEKQVQASKTAFAFAFVEGALVKALRQGHWLLLDEINLVPVETLERLCGVLESETGTLSLTERGDVEVIPRHSDFRIFACMNPATDVGKRDLPATLKSRFTEFFVDELASKEDLEAFVYQYLEGALPSPPVSEIVDFYIQAREEAEMRLLDGAGQKPRYSLRSLSRALEYSRAALPTYGFQRALHDGLCMSFMTLLDRSSTSILANLIAKTVFGQSKGSSSKSAKPLLKVPPQPSLKHILFEQFWVEAGDVKPSNVSMESQKRYVLTRTIREHLKNLARAVFMRKYPVLLQGPTSSGKTSLVEYLATVTGHRFVRINNHEHTDLQEYLGTYVTDPAGKLVFHEGILVEAVRKGYWVVLDELNLAPSDVLEALNRLLDDNRELFVPELQTTVRAHPHFMLFATQNPPGVYGGRKILSRAFRNRFVELHVDDIPDDELQVILENRCAIPGSYAGKMIEVMKDLQRHRQSSQVFAGKHGFITARDLFRWAERHGNGYEELATDGYMLLAERLRDENEKAVVHATLEKHMRVKIDIENLHKMSSSQPLEKLQAQLEAPEKLAQLGKIVWTKSMRRLFNLVEHCIRHREPVLLVGETGCGKTTVCQLMAMLLQQRLHVLNCHQHSETSDFLGGFRPVRDRDIMASKFQATVENLITLPSFCKVYEGEVSSNIQDSARVLEILELAVHKLSLESRSWQSEYATDIKTIEAAGEELRSLQKEWQSLFVWHDGPLVEAMKAGDLFLIDEISLAEDSVLERLNSVLEPKRLLVLAEKGGSNVEELIAHPNFRIMATMNPGGDFGKKELSPALRNRFTEIWVPPITDLDDLKSILMNRFENPELLCLVDPLLQFWQWFQHHQESGKLLSVRDLLAWISYINGAELTIGSGAAFVHGAFLVLLDGIGVGLGLSSSAAETMRKSCLDRLLKLLPKEKALSGKRSGQFVEPAAGRKWQDSQSERMFGLEPFFIARGDHLGKGTRFHLTAPTTSRNAFRILRAMQLQKPVLLEGSPGVGKTSLVAALAAASGHSLVRINLSEQTDIMDLLGSDLPVEGGGGGEFCWSDGVFLQALKKGDWVLLDELNLASQSVLEGLNACLDHRAEVYVPELGRTFKCPATFRIFACQNPTQQGGGRKGLPKSFLNRFSKVYVDALSEGDFLFIASALHPSLPQPLLSKMVRFNTQLYDDTIVRHVYGQAGAPWEFNLRDILRWSELIEGGLPSLCSLEYRVGYFLDVIYLQRMRTQKDRGHVLRLFREVFGLTASVDPHPRVIMSPHHLQVGLASIKRQEGPQPHMDNANRLHLLTASGNMFESIVHCVQKEWMCILVGPQASGKTSLVRALAALTGNRLHEFALSSATDITELLGSFEQRDLYRHWQAIIRRSQKSLEVLSVLCLTAAEEILPAERRPNIVKNLLGTWAVFQKSAPGVLTSLDATAGQGMLNPQSTRMLKQTMEQLIQVAVMCQISKLDPEVDPYVIMSDLNAFFVSLQEQGKVGQFEWVDGGLLKALECGDWVVLENANLCNPTVLDRLNPLLETDGTIMINERGLVRGEALVVRAHSNFRLFLTVDPSNGEVSRAMRNRGVEVFMMQASSTLDNLFTPCHVDTSWIANQDEKQVVVAAGIPSSSLTEAMCVAHAKLKAFMEESLEMTRVSLRELSQWVNLFLELLQRGVSYSVSLSYSWEQTYLCRLSSITGRSVAMEIYNSVLANVTIFDGSRWDRVALNVPGGWPSPLTLRAYLMNSKEAIVKRDIMLVESIASQFVSCKLAIEWKFAGNATLLKFSEWVKEKKHFKAILPGVMMKCVLTPSSQILQESGKISVSAVNSVEVERLLKHSALWMIRQATFSDVKLRLHFLKKISSTLDSSSRVLKIIYEALEKELGHTLYAQLFSAWQGFCSDSTFEGLPFILDHVDVGHKESTNLLVVLGSKLTTLRRSLLQWHTEDAVYEAIERYGAGTHPSAAVQSYWHCTHPTERSRVHIRITAIFWMYPLLDLLRKLEDNLLTVWSIDSWDPAMDSDFAKLQEWHEALWTILQQETVDYDNYLLCWSLFKTSLTQLCETQTISVDLKTMNELHNIVEMVDEALSLGKDSFSKSYLWKYGGHPSLPTSLELLEQESKMLSLVADVPALVVAESGPEVSPLVFDKTCRWLFVEGLSIVRWLGVENLKRTPNTLSSKEILQGIATGNSLFEAKEIYEMLVKRVQSQRLQSMEEGDQRQIARTVWRDTNTGCKCVASHSAEALELQRWPSAELLWLAVAPLFDQVSFSLDAAVLTKVAQLVTYHRRDVEVGDAIIEQSLSAAPLRDVVNFSLGSSSRSPADFVPHQQLLWIRDGITPKNTDVAIALRNVAHEMWFNWHHSIWTRKVPETAGKHSTIWTATSGPARLFLASHAAALDSVLSQSGAVRDYHGRIHQLRLAFNCLWNYSTLETSPIWKCNIRSAGLLLQQIIFAHEKSFNLEDMDRISALLISMFEHIMQDDQKINERQDQNLALEELRIILKRSQHIRLTSVVDSLLLPALKMLVCEVPTIASTAEALLQLGKVWIMLGLLRLRLVLPADGCDPMAKYAFKQLHVSEKYHDLEVQMKVKQENELLTRGGTLAKELSVLSAELQRLEDELNVLGSKIVPRPNPPMFRRLYALVENFSVTWASTGKLEGLLHLLEVGSQGTDIECTSFSREVDTWQEIAGQFIRNLRGDFPLYRDLVQPIQLGVYELKYGFSVAAAGRLQMETFRKGGLEAEQLKFTELLAGLMRFPNKGECMHRSLSSSDMKCLGYGYGSHDVEQLVKEDVRKMTCGVVVTHGNVVIHEGTSMELQMNVLRVALLRLCREILLSRLMRKEAFKLLEAILQSFTELWTKIQELREKNAETTEFLRFSKRTHSLETEKDTEEQSFKTMFPSYTWDSGEYGGVDFVDAEEDDKRAQEPVVESLEDDSRWMERAWNTFQESLLKDILKMHRTIFGSPLRNGQNFSPEDTKETFVLAYDSGHRLMEAVGHLVPSALDEQLVSANILRLGLEYGKFQEAEANHWNFYKDANRAEIALMLEPVSGFVFRLNTLLEEWQDHPILQQLLHLSKSLLSTPLDSPVMKALTGLELLLSKAQQWEENASKQVSISVELESLSRLVTRWRKLELKCWPRLLDSIRADHEAKDNKFWFFLFGILNGKVEDNIDLFVRGATKSIEEFLQTATLGQFSKRLELVRAFYGQFSFKINSADTGDNRSRARFERLSSMLFNMWKYYSQFLPMVSRKVVEEKAPIEEELTGLVHLSKWDDRSHYRLAASAEKTHRKLHKLIRNYEDILKRPVIQLLSQEALRMGTHELGILAGVNAQQESFSFHKGSSSSGVFQSKHQDQSSASSLEAFGKTLWDKFYEARIDRVTARGAQIQRVISESTYKRLSTFTSKTHQLLASTIFSKSGYDSRRAGICVVEDLGNMIIFRASELRTAEKRRLAKKKALVDLLKALRQLGLSHHKSAVPKNERSAEEWFQLPATEAGEVLSLWKERAFERETSDPPQSNMLANMNEFWQRASGYFFKNMALIQRLHQTSLDFNKDLSFQEVETATKYVEYLLHLQRNQRRTAYDFSVQLSALRHLTSLLDDVSTASSKGNSLPIQAATRKCMWEQKNLLDSLTSAVEEVLVFLKTCESVQFCPSDKSISSNTTGAVKLLAGFLSELESSKNRIDAYLIPGESVVTTEVLQDSWPLLITSNMQESVLGNFETIRKIQSAVSGSSLLGVVQPYKHLVLPLQELLNEGLRMSEEFESTRGHTRTVVSEEVSAVTENFEQIIVEAKLAVQSLMQAIATVESPEMTTPPSNLYVPADGDSTEISRVTSTLQLYESGLSEQMSGLRLDRVYKAVANFISTQVEGDNPKRLAVVGTLLGFVSVPLGMLQLAGMQLLSDYIVLHKTVTKLGYILGNLFNSLYRDGFCTTPEERDRAEGATKFEEASGTGMGEGEGKKDVSEQIEDEEQILGSGEQNQEPPVDEKAGENQDKGLEMEQNFDGATFNLSEDESDENDESEEGDENELDSKMGPTDEQDQVVDEKLWDDGEDKETKAGQEKYERDAPVSGAGKEGLEMRAKESGDEEASDNHDDPETDAVSKQLEDGAGLQEDAEDAEGEDVEGPASAYEDPSGIIPEKEVDFELPENMEIDDEEDGDGTEEHNQPSESDLNIPEDVDINEEQGVEGGEADEEGATEGEQDGEDMEVDTGGSSGGAENDVAANDGDDGMNERTNAAAAESAAKEEDGGEPQPEPEPMNTDFKATGGHEAAGLYSGVQGDSMSSGQDQTEGQETGSAGAEEDSAQQALRQSALESLHGDKGTSSGKPSGGSKDKQMNQKLDATPYRSLGDALKQWKDRVRIMTEVSDSGKVQDGVAEEGMNDMQDEADDYQYVAEGEDSGLQALGGATEDQMDQSQHLHQVGESKESSDDMVQSMVDDTQEDAEQATDMTETTHLQLMPKEKSDTGRPVNHPDSARKERTSSDLESLSLDDEDILPRRKGESIISVRGNDNMMQLSSRMPELPTQNLEGKELSDARKEVEMKLKEGGSDMETARSLWQKYDQLTARLSQELAEQLRLILEPTLAAKLEGDYRTGKRINMKKVIPYVASQFKKDKIWLRRTKASKRQYQVVIAIDDSKSMSESHCGHMALEALITTCRAMSQLEIGQMAVASFGEKGNVCLLHDFDQPFSSEAGANIISRFSFQQDNTIADEPMVDLLHFLTQMLHNAAMNGVLPSGRAALQQLVLIIADGRFHEKESLQRCVREAVSRNQLLAFIVLDNPRESIVDMQTVSFTSGAPSFSKYMDSFPFPYYTLLRNIEDLPRTLGGLLRQWFELMQRTYS